jgi:FkbM family methyltransferase
MMTHFFEFLDWALKLVFWPLRNNFSSIVLSPPFAKTQVALLRLERRLVKIKSRGVADSVTVRQIFGREDYSLKLIHRLEEISACYSEILALGKQPLILDIGANIGLAAVYFKIKFPAAQVVAVEPECSNFQRLELLSSSYDFRPLRAGLSSQRTFLKMVDPGLGENGFRTAQLGSKASTASIDGIPLDELSRTTREAIPFILKIDIEGAEKSAFETPSELLSKYKLICIEPHDWLLPGEAGMIPFLRQISAHDFDLVVRGENIFFINNNWLPLAP